MPWSLCLICHSTELSKLSVGDIETICRHIDIEHCIDNDFGSRVCAS